MPDYFDVHCHLLFGVDDGPEHMEESMALLRQEYDSGVRTIFLTPHHRKNMFECPRDVLQRNFEQLRDWAAQELPELKLCLGCELHVSMDTVQELRGGGFTMGDSDFVLLEFSAAADRRYLIERCQAVILAGFRPILAHAERCDAIRRDLGLLKMLVDMGVSIQMNAASILGDAGLTWKMFCKRAMARNLLHFVGSDAHDLKQYKPNLDACARYLERKMGADYRDQIMIHNPREIIEGSV